MAKESERQKGKELARRTQTTKGQEREREQALRAKQREGKKLTREEAGALGAVASRRSTAAARERAERAGKGKAFEEEHKVESWTSDPGKARAPRMGREASREVERIRSKQERGGTLTRHEAGVLGGAARVRERGEG